jgi:hypothetical protein
MMLATPVDLSALKRARIVNAKNAKARAEGSKPRAGSSKATATPMPKSSVKTPINLSRQVRNEEKIRKTGKQGKSGDVAVSYCFQFSFGFSDLLFLQDITCNMCVSCKDLCVYGSRVACLIC